MEDSAATMRWLSGYDPRLYPKCLERVVQGFPE